MSCLHHFADKSIKPLKINGKIAKIRQNGSLETENYQKFNFLNFWYFVARLSEKGRERYPAFGKG